MKIFVSYSRRDAGDFAEQIQRRFAGSEHDVFTDVNSIGAGEIWSSTIENNISNCDVFVSVVTYGALESPHVENEIQQAQKEKKKIIPCFHRNVREDDVKWGLNKIQGIEFNNEYDLARSLYSKIAQIQRDSRKKTGLISQSSSKEASEVKPDSSKLKEVQQYTSPTTYKKNPSVLEKRPLKKNLKLLVPVIAVVVVGSIIGFAFFSTTPTAPPETTTTPPETTTTPPEPGELGLQYSFVNAWGSTGINFGQFQGPDGVAVDSADNVYVADYTNARIQKFTSNGTFVKEWATYMRDWSPRGVIIDDYNDPYRVAVDSADNVYATMLFGDRIQKYSSNGTFIDEWGSTGNGTGQFNSPYGIGVDSQNNVYVADSNNNRIQKYSSNGTFIDEWGSTGNGTGQFQGPDGVAVDSVDNVYVTEIENNRIQKFTSNGTFIAMWGSTGNGTGQFDLPRGVAVDPGGKVYVADGGNDRIQVFDRYGSFVTEWGSTGNGTGQFEFPFDVAIDSKYNVYVADSNNNRIQVFAPKV